MGILCKAVITDRVGSFEVCEISAGGYEGDEVLGELKTTWLCRADDSSLSWGKQLVNGLVRFGKVVKTGQEMDRSVPCDKIILNRANYCRALFSMPAGNQLQYSSGRTPGHISSPGIFHNFLFDVFLTTPPVGMQIVLAEMMHAHLRNYHELN